MKVVILHPPLYPVNHNFFNLLGKHTKLTVYNFGEHPRLHPSWNIHNLKKEAINYDIKIFGKGSINFKTQINPSWVKELIKDKPDFVISVAFWIPSLYASLLKRVFGYKFLISTDAIVETEKNISSTKKRIRQVICKNTDSFISASSLTSEYLSSLCPNVTIKESLQTIDLEEWNDGFRKLPVKDKLKEELNLVKGKTVLLGVGGVTETKNWLAIFKQIKSLENCMFVLIGSGELEESYDDYIKTNNLKDVVKIIPRRDGQELKKYFKASDIFLFPSLGDRFGYVVLEALASGLPVVCTKYAGASSLIEDGFNGYVVDPHNDFYKELKSIISNLEEFQKNSSLSINKFTLENKVVEFLTILENV